MKKVDLIRAGWLSNSVGPSRTLERIIENKAYFSEMGFNVSVFTMDNFRPRNFDKEKVNTIGLVYKLKQIVKKQAKYSVILSKYLIKRGLVGYGKEMADYYLSLNRETDTVVFHDIFSCYAFLKKNTHTHAKTVLFYHNNGAAFEALTFYYPKLKKSAYYQKLLKLEKFILERIDKVVFIAEYGLKNFQKIHPYFSTEKCVFFHNGIDDLNPPVLSMGNYETYNLVCAGTLNERKGQDIIVDAFLQLPKELQKKFHITFYGNGSLFPILQIMVEKKNMANRFTFAGSVPNNKIPEKLAEANIFILMSHEEGLPISIIEAMRAGLPVISTRISGIPEQVETGINGVLLEPSVNQLSNIFKSMNQFDWKEMGKRSRMKFLEMFTFERMLASYCEMLSTLKH